MIFFCSAVEIDFVVLYHFSEKVLLPTEVLFTFSKKVLHPSGVLFHFFEKVLQKGKFGMAGTGLVKGGSANPLKPDSKPGKFERPGHSIPLENTGRENLVTWKRKV